MTLISVIHHLLADPPEYRFELRGLLPLIALNAAGLTLGARFDVASVILSSVWVVDPGIRLARVIWGRTDVE